MSKHVTGHTKMMCLLGSPVEHSISPEMHNEAFLQLGLDCEYLVFDVGTETLKTAVEGLRTMGVRGFNLTMPNKNLMAEICDKLSEASEIAGAVNTVVNDNGVLTGYTTDGIGYMMSAKDAGYDLKGKHLVQLGAGGAGTAILVQAALDGVSKLDVFNLKDAFWPRVEKIVEKLNERTNCQVCLYDISDLSDMKDCLWQADFLVNTTPVGMAPNTDNSIIPDASYFHKGLVVSDVVYNPEETKMLKMAREAGCETFNGLYMLLYQGAASFELWTGKEMPVELVKEKYFIR